MSLRHSIKIIWMTFYMVGFSVIVSASGSLSPDEVVVKALSLTTDYNSALRPPPDNGTANTINIFIYFNSLLKVDSTSQEITTKLWPQLYWLDSRLQWLGKFNSTLDNISAIYLPSSMVWQPDFIFYDALSLSSYSEVAPLMEVKSTGQVMTGKGQVVTSKCKLDMRYFPFDTQVCRLGLVSAQQRSGVFRVKIKSPFENDSPDAFIISNNDFCITDIQLLLSNLSGYQAAALHIKFKRMPTFYIINLMLPSVFLLAISAIAFCLPPECGERISFSITIVLTMCVFLQLVGNYTPTQSESIPLITHYFMAAILLTMLNVLCNAFVLSCHFKGRGSAVVSSRLIRALFLNGLVTWKSPECKVSQQSSELQPQSSCPDGSCSFDAARINEWGSVVCAADRMFFWIYCFLSAMLLIASFGFQAVSHNGTCREATLYS